MIISLNHQEIHNILIQYYVSGNINFIVFMIIPFSRL